MTKNRFFPKFREAILTGIKEIFFNKTRSFLTLIGIMLGVASLIAMMSITDGYKKTFEEFMNSWGGLSKITVNNLDENTLASLRQLYNVKGLTLDDIQLILKENSNVIKYIAPIKTSGRFTIKFENRSLQLQGNNVVGTTDNFSEINKLELEEGRNICPFDLANNSRVCVIGAIIKEELFGNDIFPINTKISINGKYFTIVGTFKRYSTISSNLNNRNFRLYNSRKLAINIRKKTENINFRTLWQKYGMNDPLWNKNLYVILPLTTFKTLYKPDEKINSIIIELKDSNDLQQKVEEIRKTLRKSRSGYEDFSVETQKELFDRTQNMFKIMTIVFGGIAFISLFVGGVGIMNVILASISERIREIGVRKSVGARNTDIFIQFLIETIVLSFFGGLIGIFLGSGLSFIISRLANMKTYISVYSIILSLSSSCFIGIIFGIYPSLKAARLNPIEALRYE